MMMLLFFITGCHHNKIIEDFTVPLEFDMNKEYEITFWAKNDSNMYQREIYRDAIKEFNKYYPNIHVNMDDTYTDYARIYNDVINNIQTGTTPNLCISYIDHVATYNASQELVIPLDDFALGIFFSGNTLLFFICVSFPLFIIISPIFIRL